MAEAIGTTLAVLPLCWQAYQACEALHRGYRITRRFGEDLYRLQLEVSVLWSRVGYLVNRKRVLQSELSSRRRSLFLQCLNQVQVYLREARDIAKKYGEADPQGTFDAEGEVFLLHASYVTSKSEYDPPTVEPLHDVSNFADAGVAFQDVAKASNSKTTFLKKLPWAHHRRAKLRSAVENVRHWVTHLESLLEEISVEVSMLKVAQARESPQEETESDNFWPNVKETGRVLDRLHQDLAAINYSESRPEGHRLCIKLLEDHQITYDRMKTRIDGISSTSHLFLLHKQPDPSTEEEKNGSHSPFAVETRCDSPDILPITILETLDLSSNTNSPPRLRRNQLQRLGRFGKLDPLTTNNLWHVLHSWPLTTANQAVPLTLSDLFTQPPFHSPTTAVQKLRLARILALSELHFRLTTAGRSRAGAVWHPKSIRFYTVGGNIQWANDSATLLQPWLDASFGQDEPLDVEDAFGMFSGSTESATGPGVTTRELALLLYQIGTGEVLEYHGENGNGGGENALALARRYALSNLARLGREMGGDYMQEVRTLLHADATGDCEMLVRRLFTALKRIEKELEGLHTAESSAYPPPYRDSLDGKARASAG